MIKPKLRKFSRKTQHLCFSIPSLRITKLFLFVPKCCICFPLIPLSRLKCSHPSLEIRMQPLTFSVTLNPNVAFESLFSFTLKVFGSLCALRLLFRGIINIGTASLASNRDITNQTTQFPANQIIISLESAKKWNQSEGKWKDLFQIFKSKGEGNSNTWINALLLYLQILISRMSSKCIKTAHQTDVCALYIYIYIHIYIQIYYYRA